MHLIDLAATEQLLAHPGTAAWGFLVQYVPRTLVTLVVDGGGQVADIAGAVGVLGGAGGAANVVGSAEAHKEAAATAATHIPGTKEVELMLEGSDATVGYVRRKLARQWGVRCAFPTEIYT
jgi:hypothetical protein